MSYTRLFAPDLDDTAMAWQCASERRSVKQRQQRFMRPLDALRYEHSEGHVKRARGGGGRSVNLLSGSLASLARRQELQAATGLSGPSATALWVLGGLAAIVLLSLAIAAVRRSRSATSASQPSSRQEKAPQLQQTSQQQPVYQQPVYQQPPLQQQQQQQQQPTQSAPPWQHNANAQSNQVDTATLHAWRDQGTADALHALDPHARPPVIFRCPVNAAHFELADHVRQLDVYAIKGRRAISPPRQEAWYAGWAFQHRALQPHSSPNDRAHIDYAHAHGNLHANLQLLGAHPYYKRRLAQLYARRTPVPVEAQAVILNLRRQYGAHPPQGFTSPAARHSVLSTLFTIFRSHYDAHGQRHTPQTVRSAHPLHFPASTRFPTTAQPSELTGVAKLIYSWYYEGLARIVQCIPLPFSFTANLSDSYRLSWRHASPSPESLPPQLWDLYSKQPLVESIDDDRTLLGLHNDGSLDRPLPTFTVTATPYVPPPPPSHSHFDRSGPRSHQSSPTFDHHSEYYGEHEHHHQHSRPPSPTSHDHLEYYGPRGDHEHHQHSQYHEEHHREKNVTSLEKVKEQEEQEDAQARCRREAQKREEASAEWQEIRRKEMIRREEAEEEERLALVAKEKASQDQAQREKQKAEKRALDFEAERVRVQAHGNPEEEEQKRRKRQQDEIAEKAQEEANVRAREAELQRQLAEETLRHTQEQARRTEEEKARATYRANLASAFFAQGAFDTATWLAGPVRTDDPSSFADRIVATPASAAEVGNYQIVTFALAHFAKARECLLNDPVPPTLQVFARYCLIDFDDWVPEDHALRRHTKEIASETMLAQQAATLFKVYDPNHVLIDRIKEECLDRDADGNHAADDIAQWLEYHQTIGDEATCLLPRHYKLKIDPHLSPASLGDRMQRFFYSGPGGARTPDVPCGIMGLSDRLASEETAGDHRACVERLFYAAGCRATMLRSRNVSGSTAFAVANRLAELSFDADGHEEQMKELFAVDRFEPPSGCKDPHNCGHVYESISKQRACILRWRDIVQTNELPTPARLRTLQWQAAFDVAYFLDSIHNNDDSFFVRCPYNAVLVHHSKLLGHDLPALFYARFVRADFAKWIDKEHAMHSLHPRDPLQPPSEAYKETHADAYAVRLLEHQRAKAIQENNELAKKYQAPDISSWDEERGVESWISEIEQFIFADCGRRVMGSRLSLAPRTANGAASNWREQEELCWRRGCLYGIEVARYCPGPNKGAIVASLRKMLAEKKRSDSALQAQGEKTDSSSPAAQFPARPPVSHFPLASNALLGDRLQGDLKAARGGAPTANSAQHFLEEDLQRSRDERERLKREHINSLRGGNCR